VFALERPQSGGRQLVQLAVNRDGALSGVYFDEFLGVSVNVAGSVERGAQRAAWSLESNPQVGFSTPLATLTSASGEVSVTGPDGAETWVAARLESPQQ
jgi:hypothetical protein